MRKSNNLNEFEFRKKIIKDEINNRTTGMKIEEMLDEEKDPRLPKDDNQTKPDPLRLYSMDYTLIYARLI